MSPFECITLMIAAVSATWAVAATIYRPKPVLLQPIYQKLDQIVEKLTAFQVEYVKKTDCIREHDGIDRRFDSMTYPTPMNYGQGNKKS